MPGSLSVTARNSIRVVSPGRNSASATSAASPLRSRNSKIASAASRPRRCTTRDRTHPASGGTSEPSAAAITTSPATVNSPPSTLRAARYRSATPARSPTATSSGRDSASPRSRRQFDRDDSANCRSTRLWLNRSIW